MQDLSGQAFHKSENQITVNKRPITIAATNETVDYGETPALAYTIVSGNMVNGDVLSGALAVDNLNAGTHPIRQRTLTAGNNYAITFREGVITTKGYYRNLDVTYEDLPEYGFVTDQPFPSDKTGIKMKLAVMASVEVGAKWSLCEKSSLYAGIYVDCGLNNALKRKATAGDNLVVYQPDTPAQFAYNTAADSYSHRIAPFAVGITVRWAFHIGGQTQVQQ